MTDREFRIDQAEEFSDDEFAEFEDYDLPSYVGSTTFQKRPLCDTDEALGASGAEVAIVGAPLDDGASNRPGARFGPVRSARRRITRATSGRSSWNPRSSPRSTSSMRVTPRWLPPV